MTNDPKPNANPAPAEHHDTNAPEQEAIRPGFAAIAVVLVLLLAAALGGFGVWHRISANRVLADTTNELAAPSVVALPAKSGAPVDSFVLPGNVSAFTDAPIYARTSGYLTKWYYDIGARVKKGALLAEIATPELDQQLAQAEADLATAVASAGNAKTQADRYAGLVKSDAVSKQDTETFATQAATTSSAVKSAEANVQRLRELQSFEKIYAPFDGVVTARNIDTGQLIDTGGARELFHMQALGTLRVYANLPQVYSQAAKRGAKIELTFIEHPGKTFTGTLVRTSDAIDPTSRTLLVEIDVDNRAGDLLPGSLAEVHFKTPSSGNTFIVPASALIFRREGMRVSTVVSGQGGDVAHLVPVVIGEDDGANVQIVSGLAADDKIIQNPPDSLIEGEKVHVARADEQGNGSQGQAGAGGK
jgi:RND family efflux transporter MFP subunit